MSEQSVLEREAKIVISAINYCIDSGLSETARESARWIASIALEFNPTLRGEPSRMCLWPRPYIVSEYGKRIYG